MRDVRDTWTVRCEHARRRDPREIAPRWRRDGAEIAERRMSRGGDDEIAARSRRHDRAAFAEFHLRARRVTPAPTPGTPTTLMHVHVVEHDPERVETRSLDR